MHQNTLYLFTWPLQKTEPFIYTNITQYNMLIVLHWTQRTTYHSFISSEQVLNQVISHSHRWKSQMEMVSLFDQKIYNIKLKISSFLYIPGTSYLVYKCITFCIYMYNAPICVNCLTIQIFRWFNQKCIYTSTWKETGVWLRQIAYFIKILEH